MKTTKPCNLHSCSLCSKCLTAWLPALEAHRRTIRFKKGELILQEGEKVTGIYFINAGIAKVHKRWGSEKELIIRFAAPGDILGHRGLGKESVYPISATALEETTACFIALEFFLDTLKVNHEFTYNLLMFYAEELQESEKTMRNMAHMPVKGRVATALLKLRNQFTNGTSGELNINLSRQDLASYAGTTYETVFRVVNEFAAEKIISYTGRKITILDHSKLEKVNWEQ